MRYAVNLKTIAAVESAEVEVALILLLYQTQHSSPAYLTVGIGTEANNDVIKAIAIDIAC